MYRRVVDDLLDADDWRGKKTAWDVVTEWNEWLAGMGEQHREPDKTEVDLDANGRAEVSYTVVRDDAADLPTDEGGAIDHEAVGFTKTPATIEVGEPGGDGTTPTRDHGLRAEVLEAPRDPTGERVDAVVPVGLAPASFRCFNPPTQRLDLLLGVRTGHTTTHGAMGCNHQARISPLPFPRAGRGHRRGGACAGRENGVPAVSLPSVATVGCLLASDHSFTSSQRLFGLNI